MKVSKAEETKFRKAEWNNSWAAQLDILNLLKQQNAHKQKILELLDKEIQNIKQRKATQILIDSENKYQKKLISKDSYV